MHLPGHEIEMVQEAEVPLSTGPVGRRQTVCGAGGEHPASPELLSPHSCQATGHSNPGLWLRSQRAFQCQLCLSLSPQLP